MPEAVEGRVPAFSSSLMFVRSLAVRACLGGHVTAVPDLAATYALPTADYGDVLWAVDFLSPALSLRNALQKRLLQFYRHLLHVPCTTDAWIVLHELGCEPLVCRWWRHMCRFYNTAVTEAADASPLLFRALVADRDLGKAGCSYCWWSRFKGAVSNLVGGEGGAAAALDAMSVLPDMRSAITAACGNVWTACAAEDPRDPLVARRPLVSYARWFLDSRDRVLNLARMSMSRLRRHEIRRCMAFRTGCVPVAVVLERRHAVPFQARVCPFCAVDGTSVVQDAQHAVFECPTVRMAFQITGAPEPLMAASSFHDLFSCSDDLFAQVPRFLLDAVHVLAGCDST
jgi:hypothetical protein